MATFVHLAMMRPEEVLDLCVHGFKENLENPGHSRDNGSVIAG